MPVFRAFVHHDTSMVSFDIGRGTTFGRALGLTRLLAAGRPALIALHYCLWAEQSVLPALDIQVKVSRLRMGWCISWVYF